MKTTLSFTQSRAFSAAAASPLRRTLCLLLAALCLLSGCGGAAGSGDGPDLENLPVGDAYGGEALRRRPEADAVFTLNFDPGAGTNPIKADSATNNQFASLIYDTIFVLDEDFSWSSELISEYRTDDFSWWVFTVAPGITFSDGTPLTVTDIVYSIRMCQQSSAYSSHMRCMYGVSAITEDSFAISASQPNSLLPAMLNIPVIKSGDYGEDYPVGSGSYVLSEDHTALLRRPDGRHADSLPLETIYLHDYMDPTQRITAFEDGRLDLVINDPVGMYNLGYSGLKETRYYDTTNMHFIGFNTRSNCFQNYLTRCAVGYLLDRDDLVRSLMHNCADAAALPCHPRSPLYDADYAATARYDPQMAAAMFREGGVDDLDDDGALEVTVTGIVVEINVKFIVNTDSAVKVMAARQLAAELNALGITTTLYELDWDSFLVALSSGDFDMYYGELRLGADWNLSPMFAIPREADRREGYWFMNYARTMDSTYTELYAAYLAADDTQRKEKFLEAARYVCDTGLLLPICFERRELLTHRDAISGLHPTQYDLFNRFPEWRFNLAQPQNGAG